MKIIGDGFLRPKLERLVAKYELEKHVSLMGFQKNEDVRSYMEESDIFIFTSDQNEGWGAVLSEAMSCACAVVASHSIGAVPYLINNGENGSIFQSKSNDDLFEKVKALLELPQRRELLGRNAYTTIRHRWNAQHACDNLITLIDALQNGKDTPIEEGPCSKAPIMRHTQKYWQD